MFITGADNNVFRVYRRADGREGERWEFKRRECTSLSEILIGKGRKAVEEEFAMQAVSGSFKFYSGKFQAFLRWRCCKITADRELETKVSRHFEQGLEGDAARLWDENADRIDREL